MSDFGIFGGYVLFPKKFTKIHKAYRSKREVVQIDVVARQIVSHTRDHIVSVRNYSIYQKIVLLKNIQNIYTAVLSQ